jgi:hypothetical protein
MRDIEKARKERLLVIKRDKAKNERMRKQGKRDCRWHREI